MTTVFIVQYSQFVESVHSTREGAEVVRQKLIQDTIDQLGVGDSKWLRQNTEEVVEILEMEILE